LRKLLMSALPLLTRTRFPGSQPTYLGINAATCSI